MSTNRALPPCARVRRARWCWTGKSDLFLSVFDIFKVGIGPSSSHTMGPMRAAREFALGLKRDGLLQATSQIAVRLYGSLALTGIGHGTDRAVLAGLEGAEPETVEPSSIEPTLQR